MYVKIKEGKDGSKFEEIPKNTLQSVSNTLGGNFFIKGQAVNEQDRLDVLAILGGCKQDNIIQYDIEDEKYKKSQGIGKVVLPEWNEDGVGKFMKLNYDFNIQTIH